MKLVVGLGNVGSGYAFTRHNAGFMIVDTYAEKQGLRFSYSKFCKGDVAVKDNFVLLKPATYMNLSGQSVKMAMDFFKIDRSNVLIVADDVESDLGSFRYRSEGGSRGHNGLRSIENTLQTQSFPRLWIGVSKDFSIPLDQYVLGRFKSEELEKLKEQEDKIHRLIDEWILGVVNV